MGACPVRRSRIPDCVHLPASPAGKRLIPGLLRVSRLPVRIRGLLQPHRPADFCNRHLLHRSGIGVVETCEQFRGLFDYDHFRRLYLQSAGGRTGTAVGGPPARLCRSHGDVFCAEHTVDCFLLLFDL
ncbi:hypothetical protein D3C73_1195400 [compost metagenome]